MPLREETLRLLVRSAVLLITFELFAVAAYAKNSNSPPVAVLRTVVSDPAGARIPSAEITFKGEKTITARTGGDGSIRVQIPYGSYFVTITRPEFKTAKITGFTIQTATPSDLEVVLHVGPLLRRTSCG